MFEARRPLSSCLDDPRARASMTLGELVFQGEMDEAVQTCRDDI